MNSTLVLAAASIALALAFRSQTSAYPDVAQRLPVLLIWVLVGLAVLMVAETLWQARRQRRLQAPPQRPSQGSPESLDLQVSQGSSQSLGLQASPASQEPQHAGSATFEEPLAPIRWPVVLGFGAAMAVYAALIPIVGYLVTTTVFIAGTLLASRRVRPMSAVLVALATTAAVWVVFIWALSLPVPILPFLR